MTDGAGPRPTELLVDVGDARLAGTFWRPAHGEAAATVLMVPGSGAADRDNDVFFPPIREHLLRSGIAISSFDRRGVGGSSGDWREQGIDDLAADVMACLRHLRRAGLADASRLGLFGHSQGGWIVLEAAAADAEVAFAITSSGPGVSPAEQERFAAWKSGPASTPRPSSVTWTTTTACSRCSARASRSRRSRGCSRIPSRPDG